MGHPSKRRACPPPFIPPPPPPLSNKGAVIGLCCVNPDGGDYSVWVPKAEEVVARHAPAFEASGARLALRRAQGSYWLQIDVDGGKAAAAS